MSVCVCVWVYVCDEVRGQGEACCQVSTCEAKPRVGVKETLVLEGVEVCEWELWTAVGFRDGTVSGVKESARRWARHQ